MPQTSNASKSDRADRPRPNILMIITDQWHPRCLGYAGHPVVRTPHLDRLAAEGAVFERMYSNQPLCMPARATMFTGLTPRGHGVRMNGIPLDPSIPTFTGALRDAGYHTHCCGKIHLHLGVPPEGADPASLDPSKYPECGALWRSGRIEDLPSPYYGLETADYCGGHGHGSFGHYSQWLRDQHPEQAHLFFDRVASEPVGPAAEMYNRSLYKWALPAELHPTTWVADRTIDFLENAASPSDRAAQPTGAAGDQPFCLMCSIPDPHSPFAAPTPYSEMYDPADVPPPVGRPGEIDDLPPHFRAMRQTPIRTSGNMLEPMNATDPYAADCAAQYFGLISLIDDQVGRVLESLRTTGLERDTLVLFMADHGEALGDHGFWGKGPYHFDGVIRVPFVMRWPGRVDPGQRYTGVTSLLDVAPTVLDAASAPIPDGLVGQTRHIEDPPPAWPGRSLIKRIADGDADEDAAALVEMDEDYLNLKLRTLVTRRYRLTYYPGQPYGELYDLENDPDELHNLWDQADSCALRDQLLLQLLELIVSTDNNLPRQTSRS